MCKFSTIKNWIRNLRKKGRVLDSVEGLREFVYLDEVSLYSLSTSLFGALPTEFTDTQMTSWQREVEGGGKLKAGIAEANVRTTSLFNTNQASQVLRKATAQSTFKDFYKQVEEELRIRLIVDSEKSPYVSDIKEFSELINGKGLEPWILNGSDLNRGQMVEMAVELEAEPTFRVSAIASLVVNIIRENSLVDLGKEIGKVEAVSKILESLINGLIPVQGRSVDYGVIQLEEKEFIVHQNIIQQLPKVGDYKTSPLYLVGVAEQSLFWKDVRRLLFSKGQFRVLSRIAQSGLQKSWSPIKLVTVLDEIDSQLSNQINTLGEEALISIRSSGNGGKQKDLLKKKALLEYSQLLAQHFNADNPFDESILTNRNLNDWDDIEALRMDFRWITRIFHDQFELEIDSKLAASLREKALEIAGLDLFGGLIDSNLGIRDQVPNKQEKRYLDTELIAIYW